MGLLFDTSSDNIGLHSKNIFNDNELSENSVTEVFSATASDGKKYDTNQTDAQTERGPCQIKIGIILVDSKNCYTFALRIHTEALKKHI